MLYYNVQMRNGYITYMHIFTCNIGFGLPRPQAPFGIERSCVKLQISEVAARFAR